MNKVLFALLLVLFTQAQNNDGVVTQVTLSTEVNGSLTNNTYAYYSVNVGAV